MIFFRLYIDKIFYLTKRAIRLVNNSKFNVPTKPIVAKLDLLTISDINSLQIFCFMYKINRQLLPSFFPKIYALNSSLHDHNTRQASLLHVVAYNAKFRAYSGTKLWNSLSLEIKNSPLQYYPRQIAGTNLPTRRDG